jgi:OOP family OmpA-OmpF porin
MKRLLLLTAIAVCSTAMTSVAQINVGGIIKSRVTNRAGQKVEQATDKALDQVEEDAKKKKEEENQSTNTGNQDNNASGNDANSPAGTPKQSLVSYGKYDFVPGEKIIFEDGVKGETAGEFPSKWELQNGKIEVAELDGEPVIGLLEGNYASIYPLMSQKGDYLPEKFSIEFDHYIQPESYSTMQVSFFDPTVPYDTYTAALGDMSGWAITTGSTGKVLNASGDYPGDYAGKWHHIALSFNQGNIKIYTDQYRLCNLPRSTANPMRIQIGCIGGAVFIKNFRIAAGGGDLYKRVMTDNKIIARGILFDVNKATLKPESMGALNEIVGLMKQHPEIKFEVGGHTDSDGDDASNLKLSQARAEAVKAQLGTMGVDAARLSTKGYGETKPLGANDSPEGKANNRRVEFVKQ